MGSLCLSPDFQFLNSLHIPPELVLKVIQYLPFEDGKRILSLGAIPRVSSLLKAYEISITHWFMRKELRHAAADFCYDQDFNLKWLSRCVERYDVVDAVMNELCWGENLVAIESHNVAVVNAGLLLLYRSDALVTDDAKLKFISSLPRDPLIAIYLALHHATVTARYHGHGWISQRTYGRFMDANQVALRNEIEFCFAEAALSVGPIFLYDMLVNPSDPAGETTLLNMYHEHGLHDWVWPCWGGGAGEFQPPRTQGPQKEYKIGGTVGEKCLFTTLLDRLAELEKCPVREVRRNIENETNKHDHRLAFLSLKGKEQLIQGFDTE